MEFDSYLLQDSMRKCLENDANCALRCKTLKLHNMHIDCRVHSEVYIVDKDHYCRLSYSSLYHAVREWKGG